MKKYLAWLLALMMLLSCTLAFAEEPATKPESHILIAYFSRVGNTDFLEDVDASSSASIIVDENGVHGNTGFMAEHIAEVTGGDLFLIHTETPYPVSYDETVDLGSLEQGEDARPTLTALVDSLDQYDVVFLGYPNWWGDLPMAVYNFLEQTDLNGKTIIPFVTSGGSGFSGTRQTLASMFPNATLLDGLQVSGSSAANSADAIDAWLNGLGLAW